MKKITFSAIVFIIFTLFLISMTTGCSKSVPPQPNVTNGDTIEVWYTGKLTDGSVFDTNIEEVALANNMSKSRFQPLTFIAGEGQVIKGFDNGVIGMLIGEKKVLTIPPEEAYGILNESLLENLTFEEFSEDYPKVTIEEGRQFSYYKSLGRLSFATIREVGEDFVIVDKNGKFAGETLIFEVELVSIN